jgi:hypothetical protein
MSASAQYSPGYSRAVAQLEAFRALIMQSKFLTPSEMLLSLIAVNRDVDQAVSVSVRNWTDWTGLSAKSRELAIRGLQKKSFDVQGRGDGTLIRFNKKAWEDYCRTADRTSRPHVEQKRAPAKPGQMIHPECRKSGCYMARQAEVSNLISIADATPNRKPVSDFALISPEAHGHPAALVNPAETSSGVGSVTRHLMSRAPGEDAAGKNTPDSGTSAADSRAAITQNQEAISCPGHQKTTNSTTTKTSPTTKCTTRVNPSMTMRTTTSTTKTKATAGSTQTAPANGSEPKIATSAPTTQPNVSNCKSASVATPNRNPISNSDERDTMRGAAAATTTHQTSSTQTNQNERSTPEKTEHTSSLIQREEGEGGSRGTLVPALPEYWPKTMTAMARVFLTAGADFLVKLIVAVRKKAPDIEDDELSRAVAGVSANTKNQRSPALWLHTVPAAVEVVRRERAKAGQC